MSNLSHKQLQRLPEAERHEASNFTLAVVMAGIFAFFVAGIASAFIYAKDTKAGASRGAGAARRRERAGRDDGLRRRQIAPNKAAFFSE